jgi:phosphinothricin acetyltransferase
MPLNIRKFRPEDKNAVIGVLNYYVHNGFAAYPETDFEFENIRGLFELPEKFPFYIIESGDQLVGFGLLHPHLKMSTFSHTVEISYFILPEYTSKSLGGKLLDRLLKDAKKSGFEIVLASISSLNPVSLNFHLKYGFVECGRFRNAGKKFNKYFDVVWMQKSVE